MIKKILLFFLIVLFGVLLFFTQFHSFKTVSLCLISTAVSPENPEDAARFASFLQQIPQECSGTKIILHLAPAVTPAVEKMAQYSSADKKLSAVFRALGYKYTPLAPTTLSSGAEQLLSVHRQLGLIPMADNVTPFISPVISVDGFVVALHAFVTDERIKYFPLPDGTQLVPLIEAVGNGLSHSAALHIVLFTGPVVKFLRTSGLEKRDVLLSLVNKSSNTIIFADRDKINFNQTMLGRPVVYVSSSASDVTVTTVDLIKKNGEFVIPLFRDTRTFSLSDYKPDKRIKQMLSAILEQKKSVEPTPVIAGGSFSFEGWDRGETSMERLVHDAQLNELSKTERVNTLSLIRLKKTSYTIERGAKILFSDVTNLFDQYDYPVLFEIDSGTLADTLKSGTKDDRFSLAPNRYRIQDDQWVVPVLRKSRKLKVVAPASLFRTIASHVDNPPVLIKVLPQPLWQALRQVIAKKHPFRFYPRWVLRQRKKDG